MKIEIETCSDCPFLSDTFSSCGLIAKKENRSMEEKDKVEWVYDMGRVIPIWCPLQNDNIIIKLKKLCA